MRQFEVFTLFNSYTLLYESSSMCLGAELIVPIIHTASVMLASTIGEMLERCWRDVGGFERLKNRQILLFFFLSAE